MVKHGNLCMGCGGCDVICPRNAIQVKLNENGFYQVYINKDKCINCGLCDKVCPIDNKNVKRAINAYSYQSNNDETLDESASGGFAFDIARLMIEKNTPVCNVHYDTLSQKPVHSIVINEYDLKKTRNSIYLQSYTVEGFKEIIQYDSGIIIGSPCQISAIHNILELYNKREKFLLVDFFCHGVPSYNLWKKYLDDCVKKMDEEKTSVQFRSKKYGWGSFTLRFEDDTHTEYVDFARDKDVFYKIFLENMALNHCCYDCSYHGEYSSADIRMGDFWGEKYRDDIKGVSALLTYSARGNKALEQIISLGTLNIEEIIEVLGGQRVTKLHIPSCRTKLLNALKGKHSLRYINNTVILKYKCLRRIKRFLKKG